MSVNAHRRSDSLILLFSSFIVSLSLQHLLPLASQFSSWPGNNYCTYLSLGGVLGKAGAFQRSQLWWPLPGTAPQRMFLCHWTKASLHANVSNPTSLTGCHREASDLWELKKSWTWCCCFILTHLIREIRVYPGKFNSFGKHWQRCYIELWPSWVFECTFAYHRLLGSQSRFRYFTTYQLPIQSI